MSGRVVAAGLGPAGPELLTAATAAAIERIPHRFLRTSRHHAAAAVPDAASFDHVYERCGTIGDVYAVIVDALVDAAAEHGEVLYLVPGSPAVAERTVELLRAWNPADVEVLPAVSFTDLAWDRLGVDPLREGVRLVDGRRFATEAAGERGPLLVAQCDSAMVLSEIKLAVDDLDGPLPGQVTVLQRLGLPEECITEVAWEDLDRVVEPDHLTSLWVPELAAPVGRELAAFAELVRTLRRRCPWDREQTHASLGGHLLEEAYETVEAIESGNLAHLREELGDLLFQVVFHATLGAEEGEFTLADVARGIHDKLVHRHPHVFGDVQAGTPGEVTANWDRIKQAEKGRSSVMEGIPAALPSLLYAAKVQRRAASVGFDWDSVEGPFVKVDEELAELRAEPSEEELGDLLFSVVNVARHLGLEPEAALRVATSKFCARFAGVEALAAERGLALSELDLAGLDRLWDEVKGAPT
ncbi:MAG: nucleoside triphosphate pyrophosphohydrolase [Actinomycetota bacterium]|nr:nucleoside triphosphate pyrophosphohydrolase [Actinomycetota bacterium]PLS76212.1 MAG: nucleoside triphosphate pyrophosphohydrolase [Actinomycetota bacterium]